MLVVILVSILLYVQDTNILLFTRAPDREGFHIDNTIPESIVALESLHLGLMSN